MVNRTFTTASLRLVNGEYPSPYIGLSGPPAGLPVLIILAGTSPSFIRNLLAVLYPNSDLFNSKSFWKTLLVDFCMTILPVELIVTLLNLYSFYSLVLTIAVSAMIIIGAQFWNQYVTAVKSTPFKSAPMKNSPFASYFRAYTNIFTGFSILAVDFMLYPEYFYKSRVYGTRMMDTGLGFYIISNAIVSPEARGIVSKLSKKATLLKGVKDTIPLVFLGWFKYHCLQLLNYHTPIQEYGVHWNFFCTLAVVKMFSTVLTCFTPVLIRPFLGPIIIVCHQYALLSGLREFVLFGYNGDAARNGFIESNREGIVSSIGYLAIYFVGAQIGIILMKKRETIGEWLVVLAQLTCVCGSSWIMMCITAYQVEKPTRKMANMSYMFFIIGVTSVTMVECLIFDIIITYLKQLAIANLPINDARTLESSDRTCTLLQAINHNGLLFFLIANLITGGLNLSVDTKSFSKPASFIILNIYMMFLSVIFLYLYRIKFNFKAYIWRVKRKETLQMSTSKTNGRHFVQMA